MNLLAKSSGLSKNITNPDDVLFQEKKIRQERFRKLVIIDFIICFLFFAPFLKLHFSIDSYTMMRLQAQSGAVGPHLTNGRFTAALIVKILDYFGINLVLDTACGVFTFMFCSAWCMAKMTEWFFDGKLEEKNWLETALVQAGCITGFCNVFIAEWYQFTETLFIYAAAVYSCVYAAYFFKERRYGLSFLTLAAGYNCYQPAMAIYVFLILFFLYQKFAYRFCPEVIREVAKGILICSSVFVVNLLITRFCMKMGVITENSRYDEVGLENIANHIWILLQNQKRIWVNANSMMELPLMAVVICIMILLMIVNMIQRRNLTIRQICYQSVMLLGGICVVYLPVVMVRMFWMAPRTIVPLFFVYTVLAADLAFQGSRKVKTAALSSLCILLAVMFYDVHIYAKDIRLSNQTDKQYIHMVQERIEEYERQSQIKVEYLGFSPDANIRWRWDLSRDYDWDVLERIMTVEWAKADAFNYLESESYSLTQVPEEYASYFMQNDWDRPDLEAQVKFDGNKCYIAIF